MEGVVALSVPGDYMNAIMHYAFGMDIRVVDTEKFVKEIDSHARAKEFPGERKNTEPTDSVRAIVPKIAPRNIDNTEGCTMEQR